MASKLKRRIPIIFGATGAAAGSGSTAGVGSTVPVGPEWLIPVATYNLGTFAPGASIPLTGLYAANGGTPYFSYVSGQTITGTSVTMTVDPVDGDITAPTTQTTYTAVIDLDDDPAEADWITRSTGAGVVWAHDFRTQAEVDAFRSPVSVDAVSWVNTDGIGSSKTLQVLIPKGLDDGYHYVDATSASGWIVRDGTALSQPASQGQSNADWTWVTGETLKAQGKVADGGWWRPFSAIAATQNGKVASDPAANGTLPVRAWTSQMLADSGRFRAGYYAHSTYAEQCRTWPAFGGGAQTNAYDGSEFYLQFRVKFGQWRAGELGLAATSANATYQNERYPPGKLAFIGVTGTTPNNEIVLQSLPVDPRFETTGSRHRMYTNFGNLALHKTKTVQGQSVEVIQPGGAYDDGTLAGTCYYDGTNAVRDCWYWPMEEWVTILVHVIPGRQNASHSGTNKDTGVEVWAARAGETSYTQIVGVGAAASASNDAFAFVYGGSGGIHPDPVWNAFLPTGYMNNAPSLRAFYHRFTQIIFSKQFIPCPQA
jgi:hypothetical protein